MIWVKMKIVNDPSPPTPCSGREVPSFHFYYNNMELLEKENDNALLYFRRVRDLGPSAARLPILNGKLTVYTIDMHSYSF